MDEITIKDFRCFHKRQTARLAPLTLLVGENSAGKTSFLAMVRALWEVAFESSVPDFKKEPYDLGSFAEIAHFRGGKGGRAQAFEGGFSFAGDDRERPSFSFNATFAERGTAAFPVLREISQEDVSVRVSQSNGSIRAAARTERGTWNRELRSPFIAADSARLAPLYWAAFRGEKADAGDDYDPTDEDVTEIHELLEFSFGSQVGPFASAPVRSKPRRTYDPRRASRDPEGDYVPMYLADLFRQVRKTRWHRLQKDLESFGRSAGLFDDLSIKSPLGSRASQPFQVEIRRRGRRLKGPLRNLIDVGYGVSQVLPLITELLRDDALEMFLLQQPEVHLHPSAQAALGTLFGQVATADRQLLVETHSDHLINRIRMDVRDGRVPLAPDDVSILYFERDELEVQIHCLSLDSQGNVCGAPASYSRFFMEETERELSF